MSKYKAGNIFISFKFATRGILLAIKSERNFRADLLVAFLAFILAFYFDFSRIEMAILVLTIGFVLFAELFNTVIEFIVDAYFGNKYSILAKMAKDTSAGAVLIVAVTAVGIGLLLFLPKVMQALFPHISMMKIFMP
ncbi:MAG: diacylglycerol kinase family protein [bacterium]